MFNRKWGSYVLIFTIILSLLVPFSTSAAKVKVAGQIWYEKPKTITIVKTKDTLQFGKLAKGHSFVGAAARNYHNRTAYIMSQSRQQGSWVEEASLFQGYEKFSKTQKQKYEMGIAFGYIIENGKTVLSYLPILDTTPDKSNSNNTDFLALPKKVQLSSIYNTDGKKVKLQVYNPGQRIKDAMATYVDGNLVGQTLKDSKIHAVSVFWGETGIGNNDYINKLRKSNKKIKNEVSHKRPYILAYRIDSKQGTKMNQWELYTPEFNGNGGHGYTKKLIKVHTFALNGKIAKDLDKLYLSKDENKTPVPVQTVPPVTTGTGLQDDPPLDSEPVYTKPSIQITSPVAADTDSPVKVNEPLINIAGAASGSVQNVTYVSTAGTNSSTGTAIGTTDWKISSLPLQPGENDLTVTATDSEGNKAEVSIKITYTADMSLLKEVPLVTIDQNNQVVHSSDFTLTGSISGLLKQGAGVTYEQKVTGLQAEETLNGNAVLEGEKWSIPHLALRPGNNQITVKTLDSQGNIVQSSVLITYDDGIKRLQTVDSPSLHFSVEFNATAVAADTTSLTPTDISSFLGGKTGIFDQVEFYTRSKFDSATLKFNYDPSTLGSTKPEDLRIFYYNQTTGKPELLNNETIDQTNHVVSAVTTHNSIYILADINQWQNEWLKNTYSSNDSKMDLVFVIDSTGSMAWNDPDNYRVQGTKDLIDKLGSNDQASVIKFTYEGTALCDFTNDKDALKNAADQIDSYGGTDIDSGLTAGLDQFEKNGRADAKKVMILLTDGHNDPPHDMDSSILPRAQKLGVQIYTIGLGSDIDQTMLDNIAHQTNGDFYLSGDASQLQSIFNNTSSQIIDKRVHRAPFQPAIVLIHGINSDSGNSALGAWGAPTYVSNSDGLLQNMLGPIHHKLGTQGVFVQDTSDSFTGNAYKEGDTIGLDSLDAQYINVSDIATGELADYLQNDSYIPNKNLFVFNWEQNDHIYNAAHLLDNYLNALAKQLETDPTVNIWKDGKPQFILIGHSAGGLVSRYYVENYMTPSKAQVPKLITIDTPHWGSDFMDNPGPSMNVLGDLNRDHSYLFYNKNDVSYFDHDSWFSYINDKKNAIADGLLLFGPQNLDETIALNATNVSDFIDQEGMAGSEEEFRQGARFNLSHPNTQYYALGGFTYSQFGFSMSGYVPTFGPQDYTPVVVPVTTNQLTDDSLKSIVYSSLEKNLGKSMMINYSPTSELMFGDVVVTIGSELGVPSDQQYNKEPNEIQDIGFTDRAIVFGPLNRVMHTNIEKEPTIFSQIETWINQ